MIVPSGLDEATLLLFIEECIELLDRLTINILALEKGCKGPPLLTTIFRDLHTINGSASLLGIPSIAKIACSLEFPFDQLREKPLVLTKAQIDIALEAIDLLFEIIRSFKDEVQIDWKPKVCILEQKIKHNFEMT